MLTRITSALRLLTKSSKWDRTRAFISAGGRFVGMNGLPHMSVNTVEEAIFVQSKNSSYCTPHDSMHISKLARAAITYSFASGEDDENCIVWRNRPGGQPDTERTANPRSRGHCCCARSGHTRGSRTP